MTKNLAHALLKVVRKEHGFAQIVVVLLLIVGLAVAVYSVQTKTNFLPKAYTPPTVGTTVSGPITTPTVSGKYYFEMVPGSTILLSPSKLNSTTIAAILRDKRGRVMIDQQNIVYEWRIDNPQIANISPTTQCTNGIKEPCPQDHLSVTAYPITNVSSTNIRAKATDRSTGTILAQATFSLNLVDAASFVTFGSIYPNGGENVKAGQTIQIKWTLSGGTVDYYNIYYSYYKDGSLQGGYVGSEKYGVTLRSWQIPQDLKGQGVKINIHAVRNGLVVGLGNSSNYFQVR